MGNTWCHLFDNVLEKSSAICLRTLKFGSINAKTEDVRNLENVSQSLIGIIYLNNDKHRD